MITTHVLDTSAGRPGKGIAIELEHALHNVWHLVGGGVTDDDGRLRTLTPAGPVAPGTYRIRFQTGAYFADQQTAGFFPAPTSTPLYQVPTACAASSITGTPGAAAAIESRSAGAPA